MINLEAQYTYKMKEATFSFNFSVEAKKVGL